MCLKLLFLFCFFSVCCLYTMNFSDVGKFIIKAEQNGAKNDYIARINNLNLIKLNNFNIPKEVPIKNPITVAIGDLLRRKNVEHKKKNGRKNVIGTSSDLKKFMATVNFTIRHLPCWLGDRVGGAYVDILEKTEKKDLESCEKFLSTYYKDSSWWRTTVFESYTDKNMSYIINSKWRKDYQKFFAPIIICDFIKYSERIYALLYCPVSLYNFCSNRSAKIQHMLESKKNLQTALVELGNLFFKNNNGKPRSVEDLYIKSYKLLFPERKNYQLDEDQDIFYLIAKLNKNELSDLELIQLLDAINNCSYIDKIYSFKWLEELIFNESNIYVLMNLLLNDRAFERLQKEINLSGIIDQNMKFIGQDKIKNELQKNSTATFMSFMSDKYPDMFSLENSKEISQEEEVNIYESSSSEEDFIDDSFNEEKSEENSEELNTTPSNDNDYFDPFETYESDLERTKITNFRVGFLCFMLVFAFMFR
jgi:hypothetical protein